MDEAKMKELSAKLAEAESSRANSEQEAIKLKEQVKNLSEQIASERKNQNDAAIAAFVETHKAVITPAIEPAFRALCENAGEGEVEVKLEEKTEKMSKLALTMRFAEKLIKAKVVPLGETPGAGNEPKSVKTPAGSSMHVELHEKAMGLIEKNPKLSYADAVRETVKAEPALAQ